MDNRVAQINSDIHYILDWPDSPEPYLLSKLVRCIAYPTKRFWLVAMSYLYDLGHWVRSHACVSCHKIGAEGDAESGERSRRHTVAVIEETHSEGTAEKAKNEFRRSLQKVFSNNNRVEEIMLTIKFDEDSL